MANFAEFIAGTNPADSNSFLKINIPEGGGPASISFGAVSNRSYTVQYADGIDNPSWTVLQNVLARPVDWTPTVYDAEAGPRRFYRLITPAQP